MGRRRGFINVAMARVDERMSIGDAHVSQAIDNLSRTSRATVAVMTHYGQSREQTLRMLFRDDDIAKLQQVRGMIEPRHTVRGYGVQPGVTLYIDYEGALVPTIEPRRLSMQQDRVGPLLNYIAEVRAIHERFEEVKAVLKYLNRHATPGAIRYYWPTALQLCPKSLAFENLTEVPSRYAIPPKIGDWMQSLKDAAATVTGSLMLPSTAEPRARSTMWLTFEGRTVHPTIETHYTTDTMTYYL